MAKRKRLDSQSLEVMYFITYIRILITPSSKEQNCMEIKSRPLNRGECFPCSFNQAKAIFKNTTVFLDFAYLGRNYCAFANSKAGFYLQNKIKGYIILSMYMQPKDSRPILSFYVLNDRFFNSQLQEEVVHKYLPEYYRFYQTQLAGSIIDDKNLMLVELIDGQLRLHKIKT